MTSIAAPFLILANDEPARVSRFRPREEDRAAIEACQRGEREAFDPLVERYQRDVYRLCYRYVNNHHDASDLAQDVFLKAYRRRVDDRMEDDELSQQVREAVSRLPEKQRATLILKIYNDLTHEEVAQVLGSTVGTVKANLFHALGNLRKAMAGTAPGKRPTPDAKKTGD